MDRVIGEFSLEGLLRHSSKDVQQRDTGLEKIELRTVICGLPACCGNEAGLERGHLGEKRTLGGEVRGVLTSHQHPCSTMGLASHSSVT